MTQPQQITTTNLKSNYNTIINGNNYDLFELFAFNPDYASTPAPFVTNYLIDISGTQYDLSQMLIHYEDYPNIFREYSPFYTGYQTHYGSETTYKDLSQIFVIYPISPISPASNLLKVYYLPPTTETPLYDVSYSIDASLTYLDSSYANFNFITDLASPLTGYVVGGGGGGSAGSINSADPKGGCGGGAGATCYLDVSGVKNSDSISLQIGSGGLGGFVGIRGGVLHTIGTVLTSGGQSFTGIGIIHIINVNVVLGSWNETNNVSYGYISILGGCADVSGGVFNINGSVLDMRGGSIEIFNGAIISSGGYISGGTTEVILGNLQINGGSLGLTQGQDGGQSILQINSSSYIGDKGYGGVNTYPTNNPNPNFPSSNGGGLSRQLYGLGGSGGQGTDLPGYDLGTPSGGGGGGVAVNGIDFVYSSINNGKNGYPGQGDDTTIDASGGTYNGGNGGNSVGGFITKAGIYGGGGGGGSSVSSNFVPTNPPYPTQNGANGGDGYGLLLFSL